MNMLLKISILLLSFVLFGCSSSYTLHVIDGLPKQVYLTFDKGTEVKVGDVFVLYRMEQVHQSNEQHGGHGGHGGSSSSGVARIKQEVGRVEVVGITHETRATVKILSGNVEDGLSAEKTD